MSLGIALDTSGSMAGSKIEHARSALDRFLQNLLDPGDELFLYRFSDYPMLLAGMDQEPAATLSRALGHDQAGRRHGAVRHGGATPCRSRRRAPNRKKALVLISDGNDTSSNTPLVDVRQLIRESEVLLYAVGIDSDTPGSSSSPSAVRRRFSRRRRRAAASATVAGRPRGFGVDLPDSGGNSTRDRPPARREPTIR